MGYPANFANRPQRFVRSLFKVQTQHGGQIGQDHLAFDRWCSHFSSRMAIKAVQIWMRRAFSLVPTKLFHFEVLLEGLEEEFNLPAIFVNSGDGRSAKRNQVWSVAQFPVGSPDPRPLRAAAGTGNLLGLDASELDQLVRLNVAILGTAAFLPLRTPHFSFRRGVTK